MTDRVEVELLKMLKGSGTKITMVGSGPNPGRDPDDEDEEFDDYEETEEERLKREKKEAERAKAREEREAASKKVLDRIAADAERVAREEAARVPEPEPERPESFGAWV